MSVSGNQETGVKSLAQQSSIDIAGVPIKKRRFFRPPSPPPEEPSSPAAKDVVVQSEHDDLSKDSRPSDAFISSSCGLSDDSKDPAPEEIKGYTQNLAGNESNNDVKVGESVCTSQSDCPANLGNGDKIVPAESSGNILPDSSNIEFNLVANEPSACKVDKDMHNQQMGEGVGKIEMPMSVANSGIALGLTGHQALALGDCGGDRSCGNQTNTELVSLNLSLSKGGSGAEGELEDLQMGCDSSDIHANRSNWDLNTTMDAWEDSADDGAAADLASDAGQVAVENLNPVDAKRETKTFICSTRTVGPNSASEENIPVDIEQRTFFPETPSVSAKLSSSEDSLHLCLGPSSVTSNTSQSSSSLYANRDSRMNVPNIRLHKVDSTVEDRTLSRAIKSEPVDESVKSDPKGVKANSVEPLQVRAVKHESSENFGLNSNMLSISSHFNLINCKSVKSEPVQEGNMETIKMTEGTVDKSDKQDLVDNMNTGLETVCSENEQSLICSDSRNQPPCPTDKRVLQGQDAIIKSSCSTECSQSGNVLGHREHDEKVPKEKPESSGQAHSKAIALPVAHSDNELKVSGEVDVATTEDKILDNSEQGELKSMEEFVQDTGENGKGLVCDEEKINFSGDAVEEDSYNSEYESDGISVPMDIEEHAREHDGFEDGEVREQLHDTLDNSLYESVNDVDHDDSDKTVGLERPSDDHPNLSHVEEVTEMEYHTGKDTDTVRDSLLKVKSNQGSEKDTSVEVSSASEMPSSGGEKQKEMKAIDEESLEVSRLEDGFCNLATKHACGKSTSEDQGTTVSILQHSDDNVKASNVPTNGVASPKVGAHSVDVVSPKMGANCDDGTKVTNCGGNKSRIINLSRASNLSSPGKVKSIPGRPLPANPVRERLPDVPLEGDKPHPRGRGDVYSDSSYRFSRSRQDEPSRSSRLNFVRGRGRISGRVDTLRGDRNSERNFAPEFYNSDFGPRHKYACSVVEADTEFINYNTGPDAALVGSGRGGRKLWDDETSIFRHRPSRGRSPGGKDGSAARGVQMARRVSRSISEEGSEAMGIRHTEKMTRGPHDDGTESSFTRAQPPYERLDGHFVQRTRNFPPFQRRVPQVRSKSPLRSRSPGPWSSSRRRSPGTFGPELSHRRSPMYRVGRMRSPDHPGFNREMVVRRHGSPPYLLRNEMRGMDSSRDPGHPRSVISSRSSNNQVLLGNNRRFGIVDPRDGTDGEEFFGGSIHSGRLYELTAEENREDRGRYGERRGPIRSFRHPFNGVDSENFHLNSEDGPGSFRFLPEDDQDFHERANLSGREFDRRIRNRPGSAPRRPRGIEDQEGNYRNGAQALYDGGFDDMSRTKRKRFD